MIELKTQIQEALAGFADGSLAASATKLLNVLGYESERTIQLSPNNYKGFSELFQAGPSNFDPDKAKVKDWQSIDVIFQLTEDDIKKSHSLFETKKVDNTIIESYLFFALSLAGEKYTRGDLVKITREINKLTPMPAMILFKYNNYLTVAVIDRRLHKRESTKDVLEKVTLIKDIYIAKPHRTHIEILYDLSLDELQRNTGFTNFVALHSAWRKTLDTSELNKKFFRELANWYFWALRNVEFPEDAEKNKDVRNAISVIRMITRLIFIWFVKEKGLVPDDLFNQAKLKSLLAFSDKNQSTYYKAVLQNLFFATLNTEMNKDRPGSRKFRGKNKGDGRDQHYMIHNVFRYEGYFTSPQDTLKKYFENIPFLNGGLFECLDKIIASSGKDKIIRIDGFSDHPKNGLKVPDYLFFSSEQPVDLNYIYGTKNKTYKVRGLIDILDSYKFTVDENTPIEEEIALDPELLGKVFENLLASYNPETQTTARKQTGSFYTPREIVNYMVDESIIAYLGTALSSPPLQGGVTEGRGGFIGQPPRQISSATPPYQGGELIETRLRHLVAYNDQPHDFTPAEVDVLISAINTLKVLDPACGSGAFPMGMLHKLVYILGKLDPDNSKWRELQRQKAIKETEEAYKIGDKEEREKRLLDISEVFENNSSDYGRKLYLIENCVFGVDIQPIAVQIAKLRFFVSLIVDQRIDPKKANLGVRPLPNLETKFVAANTLIDVHRPGQLLLRNVDIIAKEAELKNVRAQHFLARTPQTKKNYREKDAQIRAEIAKLLEHDGWDRHTAQKLTSWDPYDQNSSADFFDSEWMFSITDGFDIVFGNPPYLNVELVSAAEKEYFAKNYKTFYKRYDVFGLFFELSLTKLINDGIVTFIVPSQIFNNLSYKKLRELMLGNRWLKEVLYLGDKIFEAANNDVCVLILMKPATHSIRLIHALDFGNRTLTEVDHGYFDKFSGVISVAADSSADSIPQKIFDSKHKKLREDFDVFQGIVTGNNAVYLPTEDEIREARIERELLHPVLLGRDFEKWHVRNEDRQIIYVDGHTDIKKYPNTEKWLKPHRKTLETRRECQRGVIPWYSLQWPREKAKFDKTPKILIQRTRNPRLKTRIVATIDEDGLYGMESIIFLVPTSASMSPFYVLAILNSSLINYLYQTKFLNVAVKGEYLKDTPIPRVTALQEKPFVELVKQILAAKKRDPSADTSALERQIDEMVYALYGLSLEEIAIVEGANANAHK